MVRVRILVFKRCPVSSKVSVYIRLVMSMKIVAIKTYAVWTLLYDKKYISFWIVECISRDISLRRTAVGKRYHLLSPKTRSVKDAWSDFLPIGPQNFDLKLNRYFDGGRNKQLSFKPLLEKSSEIKRSKLVFVGIPTIYHVTKSYVL